MKLPQLSRRALQTPASPIRRLSPLARAARAQGKTTLGLNIGQPDIQTPPEFFEGLEQFKNPILAYEISEGNLELRKAWAEFLQRSSAWTIAPEHMLITMGASEALVFLFMLCCDPDDEAIIFDPTYANYMGFASITGVRLRPILSLLDDGFALPSIEHIAERVTSHTRMILLCNPNNPTGTVYSREETQALLDLCEERNIFLIVDETYREIVFDGAKPFSILELAPQSPHVIVVDSLSKRFSLCGARIGCLMTANEEVLQKALNIAQARLAAPTIEQLACAHMLRTISPEFIHGIRNTFESRRNALCTAAAKIPGVKMHCPAGAFYTIARLPVDDSEDFASYLLTTFEDKKETVFVAPAGGFYMESGQGQNKIRIAFVLEEAKLTRAMELMGKALQMYPGRAK
jgi:aspartate aminotransferase